MDSREIRSRAAFLLCGGLGTRLRTVTDRPKAIVQVAGWPFLRYHLERLRGARVSRIVFLTGHGADAVEKVFGPERMDEILADIAPGDPVAASLPMRIFVAETEPLGTGGALANARPFAADLNLVVNGDSFADYPLADFIDACEAEMDAAPAGSAAPGDAPHRESGDAPGHAPDDAPHRVPGGAPSSAPGDAPANAPAPGTILAVPLDDASDYGSIDVTADGRIQGFSEKSHSGSGLINAGAYLLPRSFLDELPDGPSSLEHDHFPRWAREGRLRARRAQVFFRDIGTPERLALAQTEFAAIRSRLEAAR
jgi:NDP-sugar pyrophosphorylase family protein